MSKILTVDPANGALIGTELTQLFKDYGLQAEKYTGKVRDVYTFGGSEITMITTDRISAFDVVLPRPIPYKGQVLNQIANYFRDSTKDIVPNNSIKSINSVIDVVLDCKPYPVEMIVRGILTGSAWRDYKDGKREICGIVLPDGMKKDQKFPTPILTPTTKAPQGSHDENISHDQILERGLMLRNELEYLEKTSLALFERGTELAKKRGLILVDTKYEFGKKDGVIYLIDEIHTPDSSRYYYMEGYQENFEKGLPQKELSKEFVRQWLIDNGFQGQTGQKIPKMTDEIVSSISERYIELYEKLIPEKFEWMNYNELEGDLVQLPAEIKDIKL